jgi:hypothetical protein
LKTLYLPVRTKKINKFLVVFKSFVHLQTFLKGLLFSCQALKIDAKPGKKIADVAQLARASDL